jgi:alpha-tubulin suppressor-like RCC1 family protein
MTNLLIHSNVPAKNILCNSIKNGVSWDFSNDLSDLSKYANTTRLGLMYDNHFDHIPFGSEKLTIDGYQYVYFRKELYHLLQQNPILDVDLLTCSLNSEIFIGEVAKLHNILPNCRINYSTNATGGAIGSDWVMESNGQSVKDVYFNQNISNYKYSLGGSNNNHSALVMNGGTVLTFGDNVAGQLGNGTEIGSTQPVNVCGITNAIMASCGEYHTAVLLTDGSVSTFGDNSSGQLGDGTENQSNQPVQVCQITNATIVACGGNHTAILLTNGTVVTFGYNDSGQLGDSTNNNSNLPIPVCGIATANAIACGREHTAVVLTNGTVYAFGYNNFGQLGNGTNISSNQPVRVCGITNAKAVACGENYTAVLLNDGTVSTFGTNVNGQLGDGTTNPRTAPVQVCGITNATAIACGGLHTVVLLDDMTICTFGNNQYGQFGNNFVTIGPIGSTVPVLLSGITNAIAIACGQYHTAVLLDDGTVRTFGRNNFGQLGDGSTNIRTSPTTVPLGSDKVFRIWDSLIGSIYCVHQDNLVRTKRGYLPIKEVVAGDTVYDERNQEITVKYNIKLMTPNREYIRIEKDALSPNVPMNDLLIVRGHPVKYNGMEIECERFVGVNPRVTEVVMDCGSYVYCLCTDDRLYVDIENVPVCTRSDKSWIDIVKNKGDIQWTKQ